MYRRIAAVVAATAAAVLLVATPAWADLLEPEGLPSLPPGLVTVEPVGDDWSSDGGYVEPEPEVDGTADGWVPEAVCIEEPFEVAPGEWDCVIEADPLADVIGVEIDYGPAPTADPEPEPEPVDIVEGDGDWGWSDAREMYGA